MRSIKISMPSKKVKMALWENTEDIEWFDVKSLKRGKPYIMAYGIKYELTKEEIKYLKDVLKVIL